MPFKDKARRYAAIKDWNRRHKDVRIGYTKKHNKLRTGRNYFVERNLKQKYDLSLEEYAWIWLKQDGRCKICEREYSTLRKRGLVVDHCHDSNKIRGLLCSPCNTMLGVLDNKEWCRKAEKYLENS